MNLEKEIIKKLDRLDKLQATTIKKYIKIYDDMDEEIDKNYVKHFFQDITKSILKEV